MDDKLIEIWLLEKQEQQNNLRNFDRSLHQIAFAIIAAIALCAPAVLTLGDIVESLDPLKIGILLLILCQIIFFATFYASMLVRSRNLCVGHIHFISDRINAYIKCKKNKSESVLFMYSEDISKFSDHDNKSWFFAYVLSLSPLVLMFCIAIYYCYTKTVIPWWIIALLIFELFALIYLFIRWYKTGYTKIYKIICADYLNWKRGCLDEA